MTEPKKYINIDQEKLNEFFKNDHLSWESLQPAKPKKSKIFLKAAVTIIVVFATVAVVTKIAKG